MHLAGQKMTFKIRKGRPKSLGHLIFFDRTIIVKFMFSKKATKIDEIFTVNLRLCSKCQIDGGDFENFRGLLRKYEFYNSATKICGLQKFNKFRKGILVSSNLPKNKRNLGKDFCPCL